MVLAAAAFLTAGRRGTDADRVTRHASEMRWQGPFEYVRDYGASGPGCAFRGRETVDATLLCTGSDLMHLACTATGSATHRYEEQTGTGGAERRDSGSFDGPLHADYDTQTIKGVALFRLSVGAPMQVRYRSGPATNGGYVLDVGGTTGDLVFDAHNPRLERRRVEPIYQPGPAACATRGRFNGTETVSMRLLPTD